MASGSSILLFSNPKIGLHAQPLSANAYCKSIALSTSNVSVACNVKLDYVKLESNDGSFYYFAKENLEFKRLEKQFQEKKLWIDGIPKLKTIAQIFKERGGYEILGTIKGKDMLDWEYEGPFDELKAQGKSGGYPFVNEKLNNLNFYLKWTTLN